MKGLIYELVERHGHLNFTKGYFLKFKLTNWSHKKKQISSELQMIEHYDDIPKYSLMRSNLQSHLAWHEAHLFWEDVPKKEYTELKNGP